MSVQIYHTTIQPIMNISTASAKVESSRSGRIDLLFDKVTFVEFADILASTSLDRVVLVSIGLTTTIAGGTTGVGFGTITGGFGIEVFLGGTTVGV